MTIDDLVALLRDEYVIGLDDVRQCLAEAVAANTDSTTDSTASLSTVTDFLERTMEAAEMVGLAGFSKYVALIHEETGRAHRSSTPARFDWIARSLSLGERYLAAPSDAVAVNAIAGALRESEVAIHDETVRSLIAALSIKPSLSAETQSESLIAPVHDADIVLKRDDADDALLQVMLADAPGQLDRLHEHLLAYANGAGDETALAESQRIAHTLKGSGSIIGLPALARVSHRLEDLLDWFVELHAQEQKPPAHAVADALTAVDLLQQMVGCLNGDEREPVNTREVLERLTAWSQAIVDGEAASFAPLSDAPLAASFTAQTPTSTPAPASGPGPVATSAEEIYLRVGATHLSRVLRRATQSIIASQRTAQQLRAIEAQLLAAQNRQSTLTTRLRELQATVDRQVVDLNQRRESTGQFDPLEMDRYDSLHILSRFVSEAVQDQTEMSKEALSLASTALTSLRDEQRSLREQHRDLLATRLVPVKTIESRLRRNVAQTARETGKQVRLVLRGEHITIDSDVLSRLTEPLLHLLRNAVDHGIEPPELRALRGKPAEGEITLDFKLEEQYVRVVCRDDGGGLDLAAIRERAIRFGLIAPSVVISEPELKALILQRGFSTKEEVSEVSGRGVGMDIVNDRVTAMKGTISIDSFMGKGTVFSLRVPVSGGIVLALLVQSAGLRVAISSEQVVTAFSSSQVDAQAKTVVFGEVTYSLQSLAAWLGFGEAGDLSATSAAVLVRGEQGALIALAVDAALEVRELVVQDVGPFIRRIAGLSVAALDETGRPVFLLDIAALERRARSSITLSASMSLRNRLAATRRRVLVVDDAISARRALQQVLEDRGYDVLTAGDGAEAIERLRAAAISLVVTDLEMPNVNGLELARRLRDVPQWADIPIIMVTSRTGEKYRQSAFGSGVDEYVVKPFVDADLLATVKRLIETNRKAPPR